MEWVRSKDGEEQAQGAKEKEIAHDGGRVYAVIKLCLMLGSSREWLLSELLKEASQMGCRGDSVACQKTGVTIVIPV